MLDLPFSISSDAALWVVDQLQAAEALPQAAGLVPALDSVERSISGGGKEHRVLECIPFPHFEIGWHRPEGLAERGYVGVEIFGRKLFLHSTTLEELKDKHLVLQPVKSSLPMPAGQKRCVLRTGTDKKGILKFLSG